MTDTKKSSIGLFRRDLRDSIKKITKKSSKHLTYPHPMVYSVGGTFYKAVHHGDRIGGNRRFLRLGDQESPLPNNPRNLRFLPGTTSNVTKGYTFGEFGDWQLEAMSRSVPKCRTFQKKGINGGISRVSSWL